MRARTRFPHLRRPKKIIPSANNSSSPWPRKSYQFPLLVLAYATLGWGGWVLWISLSLSPILSVFTKGMANAGAGGSKKNKPPPLTLLSPSSLGWHYSKGKSETNLMARCPLPLSNRDSLSPPPTHSPYSRNSREYSVFTPLLLPTS